MTYGSLSVRARVNLLAAISFASLIALAIMFLASGAFVERLQDQQEYYSDRADHVHKVKSVLLQLNTIGMDYVNNRNPEEKTEYLALRATLRPDLDKVDKSSAGLSSFSIGETTSFSKTAENYFILLEQAFSTRERLGLDQNSDLEGSLRRAIHAIEARLFALEDHELGVKMLMMRRHEKDFMMRLDDQYIAKHKLRAAEFRTILDQRSYPQAEKQQMLALLESYENDFREWCENRLKFAVELSAADAAFTELINKLSQHANLAMQEYEVFTARQQTTLKHMAWITWLTIGIFSLAGLFASWRIGRSIAIPVRSVASDMLALCESRTGSSDQFRCNSRNEVEHLRSVLAYFQETLEDSDRLNEEVRYHRDNLSEEVVKRTRQLQEQTLRLEQALEQEKELNQMTNQFVSTVSHEFRTPLTIIDAAARRVNKKLKVMSPDEIHERLNCIRSATKRLSDMVERTLDSSRLASGQVDFIREDMDIVALVREVVDRHKEIAPGYQFRLNTKDVPETIRADGRLLDHVFSNLVSNAIKYSAKRPDIHVFVEGNKDSVEIRIRDHGVGIPKTELPMISERFFRASTSKGIKGTGIGLNLVSKLIKLHNGCFCIDSEEGEWTEVSVRLPVGDYGAAQCPDAQSVCTEKLAEGVA